LSNGGKDYEKIIRVKYISPLHLWCISNFQNDFYLWCDNLGINVIISDPSDMTLWKLTWGLRMPTPNEMFDLALKMKIDYKFK
jgi:hypothetical protein